MGDKGGGRGQKSQKRGDIIYEQPLTCKTLVYVLTEIYLQWPIKCLGPKSQDHFANYFLYFSISVQTLLCHKTNRIFLGSTLKPWYNEPQYSEFHNIMYKTQLPFWGFTKHTTFDIRYSEQKGSDGVVCYIQVWVYK